MFEWTLKENRTLCCTYSFVDDISEMEVYNNKP